MVAGTIMYIEFEIFFCALGLCKLTKFKRENNIKQELEHDSVTPTLLSHHLTLHKVKSAHSFFAFA